MATTPHPRSIRRWMLAAAPLAVLGTAALGVHPAAADQPPTAAAGAQGEAPGNAGTVKTHEQGTPDADRRDEPKVCELRIVGFGFPADADLELSIVGHGGPNAGPDSWTSVLGPDALSAAGDWAVDGPSLADGMYKLEVENATAPGGAKQKVFKVDCPDTPGTGAVGGDTEVDGDSTGAEVGGTDVTGTDVTGTQVGGTEVGGTEVGGAEVGGTEVGGTEVGGTEVGGVQTGGTMVLGETLERPVRVDQAAAGTAPTDVEAQAIRDSGTHVLGMQVSRSALPRTGSDLAPLAAAGFVLLGAGAGVEWAGRRRRVAS